MTIQFSNDYFQKGWVRFGLDSLIVSDSVKAADASRKIEFGGLTITLYLKKLGSGESLLVVCKSGSDAETVEEAFRLKPGFIPQGMEKDPAAVLQLLAEKHGLAFLLKGIPTKLVMATALGTAKPFTYLDNPMAHENAETFFGTADPEHDMSKCTLGFVIDSTEYLKWLES